MKICVLGLDGAATDLIFNDERLGNLRRMMEVGLYGRLQGVIPPATVPSWMCMTASQDPGSLGVYSPYARRPHSYDKPAMVNSSAAQACQLWDHIAGEGKRSILLGVPPNYPPRRINGISIGCFLTPNAVEGEFTWPADIKLKLQEQVGEYAADVKDPRSADKSSLRDQIFALSRTQWDAVRWLLREQEWDYFHFVDIGIHRIQQAFWDCFDRDQSRFRPGNPYENVIADYYLALDEQIGSIMELLDEQTILLVVSPFGAQGLTAGFALNQWLADEGLLVLEERPAQVTPFDRLKVDWSRTQAWCEGGDCAQIFFNVQGREPQGSIPAGNYDSFLASLRQKLLGLKDVSGAPLNLQVVAPTEIYSQVTKPAPDLLVNFGGAGWRALYTVGHAGVHVRADHVEDSCSYSPAGMFILAAPNCPLSGEYEGASLLDLAPTLLDLAGYSIPPSMQGRSLVAGMEKRGPFGSADADQDRLILDRLAGLGYI